MVETSDSSDVDLYAEQVVVEEELTEVAEATRDEVYGDLSNLSVDLDFPVPLYDVAWPNLLSPRHGRLLEYSLFAGRLDEIVEEREPDTLVCGPDLDAGFAAAVSDVGRSRGVRVEGPGPSLGRLGAFRRCLATAVLVVPFLADQVASLLLQRLFPPESEARLAFMPALLRLESMLPVVERADFDADVVVASKASSWLWPLRHDALDAFSPQPLSAYTGLGCIRRQLELFVALQRAAVLGDGFFEAISPGVADAVGLNLNRTLRVATRRIFGARLIIATFLYLLARQAVEEVGWRAIVIGTHAPSGRAIELAAIDAGAEAFHIPHSIAMGYAPNPPPALNQFVAGPLDVEFFETSRQVREPWNMIVTGRPYLTNLYAERRDSRPDDAEVDAEGPVRVLLATQPLKQRMAFVASVLEALEATPLDATVTVKVHPSEDVEDYAPFANDGVMVTDSDLRSLLFESDLTLTINSNVGLESAIVGTPSACVNRWSPVILTPPFARDDAAIPALETPEALRSFLKGLDQAALEALRREQEAFVHEGYVLEEDAVGNIVEHLEPYTEG